MKRHYISFTVFAFLIIFSFIPNTVYGKSIKDLESEKDKLKQESQKVKDSLSNVKTEKNTAENELYTLDNELAKVNEELVKISEDLENTTIKLKETQLELKEAEKDYENQYETFKKRARYMYMNGSISCLDVIFSASSFSDMFKRIDYVNRIVDYDMNLIENLKETEELISVKVDETSKRKDDLEALEIFQKSETLKYEKLVDEKKVMIASLSQDEANYQSQLDKNEAESKEVEQLIQKIQEEERKKAAAEKARQQASASPAYTYDGGSLQWPVPGRSRISSGYGNRVLFGRSEFHTGIDIPAPYAWNILAAEGGTVIRASYMNGYGNTVIIDHGGGLSTLYAHNSSLVVKAGDKVSRGQVIAKCGSTGFSTGNHSHFETRINGSHTNPRKYVSP